MRVIYYKPQAPNAYCLNVKDGSVSFWNFIVEVNRIRPSKCWYTTAELSSKPIWQTLWSQQGGVRQTSKTIEICASQRLYDTFDTSEIYFHYHPTILDTFLKIGYTKWFHRDFRTSEAMIYQCTLWRIVQKFSSCVKSHKNIKFLILVLPHRLSSTLDTTSSWGTHGSNW